MELTAVPSERLPKGVETISLVVFTLQGREHALKMDPIREIIRKTVLSPVVEAPDFVDGVVLSRGRITPVVNLKKRLQITENEASDDDCVIVVQWKENPIGFKVDAVSDIIKAPVDAIEAPTEMVGGVSTRFIDGCVFLGDRFLVILNLEEILATDCLPEGGDPYEQIRGEPDENTFSEADNGPRQNLRRIITFDLDGERYGADIGEVVEILKPVPATPLPNMPGFFLGLINLRNTIVPLVDLRPFLRLNHRTRTEGGGIVVVKHAGSLVGAAVDRIGELVRVSPEIFKPPPNDEAGIDAQYLQDVGMVEGRMITTLDIRRILSDMEQAIRSYQHGESRGESPHGK